MTGKQKKKQASAQAKAEAKNRQSSQAMTGYGDKKTEGPDRPST
ncbi:hypothetical protein [Alteribacter natronophilus]|nr:hypothetical protein [Alteribacter natronophilus]